MFNSRPILNSLSLPFSLKSVNIYFRAGKQRLQMSSEASQKKRADTVNEFLSNPKPPADPDLSDLMMDQLCLSPEKLVGSQC